MITKEDVADLQPGDVVEIRDERWPDVVIRGPVRITDDRRSYAVGEVGLAPNFLPEYRRPYSALTRTLTVVSRAPCPLYVNSDRTEPVPGDVAKDADGHEPSGHTWHYLGDDELGAHWWRFDDRLRDCQPKRLRLLVDGETGQAVTP